MNTQELIDKAVERHGGMWPVDANSNLRCALTLDVICNREQFAQRARELGWCNGYKYGVEYETNGKKPDLPDDTLVTVKFFDKWERYGNYWDAVENWAWGNSCTFKIIDERYKPVTKISEKQQNVSVLSENNHKVENVSVDNSWHEKGEWPPVGL